MKYFLIMPIFYLASCMNTSEEKVKPVYDEASLRAFVLSTPSMNEGSALDSLDRILINASKDSVLFRKTVSFLSEPFSSPNSSYRNQQGGDEFKLVQYLWKGKSQGKTYLIEAE
jgi:hypothetical protein